MQISRPLPLINRIRYNQKKALKIHKKTENLHGQASSLNNIGTIFYIQNDWEKARKNLNGALQYSRYTNDKRLQAAILNNLGLVLFAQGDVEKALESFESSYKTYANTEARDNIDKIRHSGLSNEAQHP